MMTILPLLAIYSFVILRLAEKLTAETNVVEIPPAIYKRLLSNSCQFMGSVIGDSRPAVNWYNFSTRKSPDDGKYYFYTSQDIDKSYDYVLGYYILKDI